MGAAIIAVGLAFNAHHDSSENFTRFSIWEAALRMMQRFPLSGVGPFDVSRIYPFVRSPGGEPIAFHAHSIVLTIAAETGLIGIAALCFGWCIRASARAGTKRWNASLRSRSSKKS
jgi:O-antigen ligase